MPNLFIPKERRAHETRVAAVPETVKKLVALGFAVTVERAAGEAAGFIDAAYVDAGAALADDDAGALDAADLVLTVSPPGLGAEGLSVASLRRGAAVIGLLAPYGEAERIAAMAERDLSAVAMELIPRISRAQSMDVLSSQANVGGYKAVLLAAVRAPRFFPLLMTAAGTVRPSKVIILGGGVAGLQALATAKRLGALVEVSDIRPDVREQVESLGGKFIELPELPSGEGSGGYAKEMDEEFLRRQREILTEHLQGADVVVTTAQIPGKKAPVLLTRDMVAVMKPGAVVVDLAAEQGGNCELTRAGEEVESGGVLILGPHNLPSTVAGDASTLYARNLLALIQHMCASGAFRVDPEDEIVGAALVTHGGEVVHAPTRDRLAEVRS